MDKLRVVLAACSSKMLSQSAGSAETTENEFRWITKDLWNLRQKSETFRLQNSHLEFSLKFEWKMTNVKWVESEGKTAMLNENLNRLLESRELSDTVIQAQNGSQLSVHKSILSARSPVFLAMFKSDMLESRNNCIEITDLLPETVKTLIEYIYTERLPELTYDSATELLKASDKYDIPCLKEACSRYLLQHLNISNALDLLSVMDTYREHESKKVVLKYVLRHRDHFMEPGSFDRVSDPELLKEILHAVLKK